MNTKGRKAKKQATNNNKINVLSKEELGSRIVINLASKEYSKCIEKYLQPDDRYITCIFGELEGDKVVQKGVYAKMTRGEMVRFMAGIHAEAPEQMKDFNWSGYRFDGDRSSDQKYIFIRTTIPEKESPSF